MAKYRTKYKHDLQVSRRGIGHYPWPKERLIDYTSPDVLDRICEQFPNQYAFRYTELDYTRTYEQFREVFVQPEQTMAVEEKKLRNYYDISENCYAYERVWDVIEDVMHDEKFRLNPPMKNPLIGGGANIERIKNMIETEHDRRIQDCLYRARIGGLY